MKKKQNKLPFDEPPPKMPVTDPAWPDAFSRWLERRAAHEDMGPFEFMGRCLGMDKGTLKKAKRLDESAVPEPVNDIWKDPQVVEALRNGRTADDIAVLACPDCNRWGYYNQGSSFSCRFCDKSWYCCAEGEGAPESTPHIHLEEEGFTSLADTVTDTTEGYHNETRPGK